MTKISKNKLICFVISLVSTLAEVFLYWCSKIWSLIIKPRPESLILEKMRNTYNYDDWLDLSYELDNVLGNDLWRANPMSSQYDCKLIAERLDMLLEAKESRDVVSILNILRSGLVRNLGNIANKKLFTYTGTKFLIEKYNMEVIDCLRFLLDNPSSTLTAQAKLDLVHDTRQSYGLSTLVLQGGVLFGLCHLGVVKALHEHQLLPRIISGVGVGALIAALVCVHTDVELPDFLSGNSIDLSRFASERPSDAGLGFQRLKRFYDQGYLLDIQLLDAVVREHIGTMTFEEAYIRTRRVLNIAVFSDDRNMPTLFNFLTTPNVLIASAACASNALPGLYDDTPLQCKDECGNVVRWNLSGSHTNTTKKKTKWRRWSTAAPAEREAPYTRVAELFNVNHFIVSQARPYLAPFFAAQDMVYQNYHRKGQKISSSSGSSGSGTATFIDAMFVGGSDGDDDGRRTLRSQLFRLAICELRHRLSQLESVGLLPSFLRRLMILDDRRLLNSEIIAIAPELGLRDFWRLLVDAPRSREDVEYWGRKGEQSAWFALPLIRQRCGVEFVLDSVYTSMLQNRRSNIARSKLG
ncbi:uncharacterized protein V1518DRAFT_419376 [Limtongia smithiae]|uniref:uncharacterized protein n=1 Tax=Limtongia smithiae TaxID=1125753 RepID=UPI0034CF24C4